MDDLLAARLQMALSLGFHIVFASIGMAMPFFMAAAHHVFLRTGDRGYLTLTKMWSKGVAIFFAVGAVSGTALSFELGLLWPEFMKHAGPIIGMPFSLEGTAFFIEAIALGLFLYGWDRLPPRAHWWSGVVVGVSGVLSGWFVVCANAWMNAPTGFEWNDGVASAIDPVAAMFNRRSFDMGLHMVLAAFVATGTAIAGLHAWQLLRHPGHPLHERALKIVLPMTAVFSLLQPLSGDLTAKRTAQHQPLKLAAMEAHFETEKGAGLTLGGWPDVETRTVKYGLEIPYLLSILAFADPTAEVKGLNEFPRDQWPNVPLVHLAYQVMIGIGSLLAGLSALYLFFRFIRKKRTLSRRFLPVLVAILPLGFIALEAGWTVTETGRQPWIIYGIMRTKDAVTPMPGIAYSFIAYLLLYAALTVTVFWLMLRQIRRANREGLG